MFHAFQWFMFAMFVWCCVLCMEAVEQRVAPGKAQARSARRRNRRYFWRKTAEDPAAGAMEDPRELEIKELRERIETLEAIVTDRRYQWDEEYSKD